MSFELYNKKSKQETRATHSLALSLKIKTWTHFFFIFRVQKFLDLNILKNGVDMTLNVVERSFYDLAPVPNGNGVVLSKAEDSSICSCSGVNEFVDEVCTPKTDAKCKTCTNCGDLGNYYQIGSCSGAADTQCALCSTCQHLYCPETQCSGTTDTKCSVCTECSQYEYETSPCTGGDNRICSSCLVCVYLSAAQEIACNKMSQTWRRKNCCFNKDGEQVSCDKVDFANAEIDGRNGRHHWVFPDTTPKISGYGIYEWSGS